MSDSRNEARLFSFFPPDGYWANRHVQQAVARVSGADEFDQRWDRLSDMGHETQAESTEYGFSEEVLPGT